ncbi:hypothetical protein [Naasia sp. SYSU D00948]|uniref:hypothetical protein n=1 Tax=Naasia sp. SYSU D00948 TaxID=2817379 RepID=UPI001B30B1FD|nr:hypothetical protein [Naasia sp. SYSU D00948]
MRVLYVVLLVLAAIALLALGTAGAIAAGLEPDGLSFFLVAVALILLALPPLVLGAFLQSWPVEPWRGTGRKDLARMLSATVVVQLVGAGLLLLLAVDDRVPLWQPVAFLAAVAVVSAVNVPAAVAVRRHDALRPPPPPAEWSRDVMLRKTRTVQLWAFGTLLVAGAGVLAIAAAGGLQSLRQLWVLVALAVSLACIAGSAACLIAAWPLARRLREEREDADGRAVVRSIRQGRVDPLLSGREDRVVGCARVLASYVPFQIAQLTLLYAGLLLAQLPSTVFAEDRPDLLSTVVLAVLIVTYALFLPLSLRLWRGARRYAAVHEDVLAPN